MPSERIRRGRFVVGKALYGLQILAQVISAFSHCRRRHQSRLVANPHGPSNSFAANRISSAERAAMTSSLLGEALASCLNWSARAVIPCQTSPSRAMSAGRSWQASFGLAPVKRMTRNKSATVFGRNGNVAWKWASETGSTRSGSLCGFSDNGNIGIYRESSKVQEAYLCGTSCHAGFDEEPGCGDD